MANKSNRRRAREYAMQGVYQWLLAGGEANDINVQLRADQNFDQADAELFGILIEGTLGSIASLEALLTPHLDRPIVELTPVERAILLVATFELRDCPATPYRVIVNEAIELAKTFGGTDGHRFVNGVLDKLAPLARPAEARA